MRIFAGYGIIYRYIQISTSFIRRIEMGHYK